MTANAFCSVSLRPPLVLVCIDQLAETYLHLHERGQFGVSVLKESEEALSEFFADPERNLDAAYRLGIQYKKLGSGTPVLEEALANLDCRVTAAHAAGDHHFRRGSARSDVERRSPSALLSRPLRC